MTQLYPAELVSAGRDALSRAARNVIQALIPTLLVVAGGSITGIDVTAVALLAIVTAVVSLLKSILGAAGKVPADAPIGWQLGERAAVAAAGTALGLLVVDGTVQTVGIDFGALVTASVGSALTAVAMFFTNRPPAVDYTLAA